MMATGGNEQFQRHDCNTDHAASSTRRSLPSTLLRNTGLLPLNTLLWETLSIYRSDFTDAPASRRSTHVSSMSRCLFRVLR